LERHGERPSKDREAGSTDGHATAQTSGRASVPPPDATVLSAARQRDPDGLARFFDHYFRLVYGLTFRLLGNTELAEDATQDIFYRLQRAIDKLDPDRDPTPWVITVALNACRSIWRSTAHRMDRQTDSWEPAGDGRHEPVDQGRSPAEELEQTEREQVVQAALLALPENLRSVVVLRDYQGLNHQEIAAVLGLRHGAVRKRYSRALHSLADLLRGKLG